MRELLWLTRCDGVQIKAYRGEVDASAAEIAKLQNATKDISDKKK